MPVVFEAAADAAIGGTLVDFRGQHQLNESKVINGSFKNFADFVLGQPNNSVYYGCTVDKLAFAVVEKLPYSIEIVQPKVPLVRNGQMTVKIIAHRDEGFEDPINIQFPFRSPGVGDNVPSRNAQGKVRDQLPTQRQLKCIHWKVADVRHRQFQL